MNRPPHAPSRPKRQDTTVRLTPGHPVTRCVALALTVCLALGACAAPPPADAPADGEPGADAGEERPDVRTLEDTPPPIEFEIRRSEYAAALPETLAASAPGIETLAWTTRKPGPLLREFLDGLTEDLPPEPEALGAELQRWRASGFEVRVLPTDRLGLLVSALTPQGSLNHRAWGVVPGWQPLHAAPDSQTRLATAAGPVEVPAGATPRLLVRAWTEPHLGPDGLTDLVRIELVPQLHEPPTPVLGRPARLFAPIEQGRALADQSLTLALGRGECLLLTASAPAEEPATGAGPPRPGPPTLASALLRSDTGRTGATIERDPPVDTTVIVLVPVTGEGGDPRW